MKDKYQYERSDLGHVRASLRHLFVIVGPFSFLVNLLLLTGPLYMLEPVICLNPSVTILRKRCGNINFCFSHRMFAPIAVVKQFKGVTI